MPSQIPQAQQPAVETLIERATREVCHEYQNMSFGRWEQLVENAPKTRAAFLEWQRKYLDGRIKARLEQIALTTR